MRRAFAMTATATLLCACTPLSDMYGALPPSGHAVADAREAMAIAEKACRVFALQLWLSPYRWRVTLSDGIWHVRVPALGYGLDRAYSEVEIRAADGATGRCTMGYDPPAVIAGVD